MDALKFAIGFGTGAATPCALVYLTFVYPYSQTSLRPLWWGLGLGLCAGLAGLAAAALWIAAAWPRD